LRGEFRKQQKDFQKAKFPTDSIIGLRKQYNKLKNEILEMSQADPDFDKRVKEAKRLSDQLKVLEGRLGNNQRNVGNYASAFAGAGSVIKKALPFAGLAVGVQELGQAVRDSIQTFADFERQINFLGAVSGATDEQLAKLEEQAKSLGETTQFSASQVAQLQIEYSKLGFTADETLAATADTLNLASVAQSELGETAEVVGSTLRAFNLDASETGRVTDVAAKAFSSSALDLQKFQTAMAAAAPVAAGFGVSIEETSALLGVLVDAGLDASTAGTGLRNVLLDSAAAGISYEEALDQVANATDSNLKALELFGKRGATIGTVLAANRDRVAELNTTLEDSAGFAKEAGDAITDDLQGDFDGFMSAVEGFQLRLVSFFETGLRKIVQFGTGLVRSIGPALEFISRLLKPLRDAFSRLFSSLSAGEVVTDRFNAIMTFLGNVVGAAVDILAYAIDTIAFYIEKVKEAGSANTIFGKAFRLINKAISDAIRGLADIPAFIGGIFNAAKRFRDDIANLEFSTDSLKEAFNEGFNRVRDASKKTAEDVEQDFGKTSEGVNKGAMESVEALERQLEDTQKKVNKFAADSIAGINAEISRLKKDLEQVTDTKQFLTIDEQIRTAEQKLEETKARFQRAADAERGVTTTLSVLPTLEEDPEEGVRKITELLDLEGQARLDHEQDVQEKLQELKDAAAEKELEKRKERFDREIQLEQELAAERAQIIGGATEELTSLMIGFLDNQEVTFKEFSKQIVLLALDVVEKEILLQVAAAQAKSLASAESVATFGAAGLAKAAIITGLIKGFFSVVKSQVQSFALGGEVLPVFEGGGQVSGIPNITRPNGDNVLATVRVGELFLNEAQQKRARLIYGNDIFSRLGVPGFAEGGAVMRTPQLVNPGRGQTVNVDLEGPDTETFMAQARIIAQAVAEETAEKVKAAIVDANERSVRINNLLRNQIQE